MEPRNGRPSSKGVSRCRPVPASSTRVADGRSWATPWQGVLPPYRTKSGPGDGVEPRTPKTNKRTEGESTGSGPSLRGGLPSNKIPGRPEFGTLPGPDGHHAGVSIGSMSLLRRHVESTRRADLR